MLEKEIAYFKKHQAEWAKQHPGKFVLIKGEEVVGFFPTEDEALAEGARRFGLTPFLVRAVDAPDLEIRIPALTLGVLHADPAYTGRSSG